MRNPTCHVLSALIALLLWCATAHGQNTYEPANVGYVNFNLGTPLLKPTHQQTVSLYGCNTRITIDGKRWYRSDSLQWGAANQVLDSVPFGPQIDPSTGSAFYISKYYVAAPPVIQKDKKAHYQTQFNIGKVIPDCFAFDGNNPMQLVYFDYSRFQLMQVKFVPVKFDSSFYKAGIGILPINIDCKDFPWKPVDYLNNITGASGIGDLQPSKSSNFSGLFLPYYYTNKAKTDSTFLHCEVTILNDIIPYYECYFDVKGKPFTTIDLGAMQEDTITVKAIPRLGNPMPCGCRKPEEDIQCD